MFGIISEAEAPFLRALLGSMPALVTTDDVLAAAETAEIMLEARGIPEVQRPGHRITLEAAHAFVTLVRGRSGWTLDRIEEAGF
ncbi:hypothetical protein AB1K56_03375 [Microbacterium sp. BWR-S6Y]|uniref:hypothetical protein n=1 Tax=Microbacterium sp. BWR-S6Y TaxID=3232073 RepID=UPI0035288BE9